MDILKFNAVIGEITVKAKKTEGQIAQEMGYGSNYISTVRTRFKKGEPIPTKFITQIQGKYGHLLAETGRKVATPIIDITGQLGAILARQRVQGYYQAVLLSEVQKRPLMTVLEEMNRAEADALKDQLSVK